MVFTTEDRVMQLPDNPDVEPVTTPTERPAPLPPDIAPPRPGTAPEQPSLPHPVTPPQPVAPEPAPPTTWN